MKRIDERHIERIIKKVIKEDMFDNNMEYENKELIKNSTIKDNDRTNVMSFVRPISFIEYIELKRPFKG